jgi:hypothetical protein
LPYGWSQVSVPNLVFVFLLLVCSGYVGLLLKIMCFKSIKYMPSYDMIYLLTAVGLSPSGSTHLHTNSS